VKETFLTESMLVDDEQQVLDVLIELFFILLVTSKLNIPKRLTNTLVTLRNQELKNVGQTKDYNILMSCKI